jgi:hypothetical protein
MNLEYYIQQLLFSFDCVIIPNFGGIVAQHLNASYNSTQHIFYPPKKQLAFNNNLNKSDGLLVNHVALNKNISFSEANNWVELQVSQWKKELSESKKLSIAEVGRFFVDKEANIQFEPAIFINYNPEAFGCLSFHLPSISELTIKQNNKPLPKFVVNPKLKLIKQIGLKKLVPYAVAIPILIAAIYIPAKTDFLIGLKSINYSNLNPFSNPSIVDTKYSERIQTILPKQQDIKFKIPENQEAVTNSNTTTISTPVAKQEQAIEHNNDNIIHLIVGAFSTQENADELVSALNTKGFHAYIQGKSQGGLIRVSCNKFESKSDANAAKSNVKEQGFDAWLLQE